MRHALGDGVQGVDAGAGVFLVGVVAGSADIDGGTDQALRDEVGGGRYRPGPCRDNAEAMTVGLLCCAHEMTTVAAVKAANDHQVVKAMTWEFRAVVGAAEEPQGFAVDLGDVGGDDSGAH